MRRLYVARPTPAWAPLCIAEFVGSFVLAVAVRFLQDLPAMREAKPYGGMVVGSLYTALVFALQTSTFELSLIPAMAICRLCLASPQCRRVHWTALLAQVAGASFANLLCDRAVMPYNDRAISFTGASTIPILYIILSVFVSFRARGQGHQAELQALAFGCVFSALPLPVEGAFHAYNFVPHPKEMRYLGFVMIGVQVVCGLTSAFLLRRLSVDLNKLEDECIGTFFLVLTAGMFAGAQAPQTPVAVAFMLAALVYGFGVPHLNPAVSLAVFLDRRQSTFNLPRCLTFIAAQLIFGIGAIVLCRLLEQPEACLIPVHATHGGAASAEAMFTAFLCFTFIHTCENVDHKDFHGLKVGAALIAGAIASTKLSGGVLNPAVSLAVNVVWCKNWPVAAVYICGQFAGSVLGVLAAKCIFPPPLLSRDL